MKRIISMVLLFCLSFNTFAGTLGVQKLERELDEYHFALMVEWDQKDQSFYDQKTKDFFSSMEKIIREDGLSKTDVLTLVERKLVSHKSIEALKLKLSLLSNSESPEVLAQSLQSSAQEMYSQGASWNGELTLPIIIGVVVVAVLAYKFWWDKNHICQKWEERYDCSVKTWTDRNCNRYIDPHGFEREECDYYYQKAVTETCGMMNFCLNYKEI